MVSIAVGMGCLAVLVSVIFGAPAGRPRRLHRPVVPAAADCILALALPARPAAPHAVGSRGSTRGGCGAVFRERVRTHWTRDRGSTLVVIGVLSASTSPTSATGTSSPCCRSSRARTTSTTASCTSSTRRCSSATTPARCCTSLLGTGVSAEVLSTVYLWFLPLVPLALAAWLIWSRNLGFGYWFAVSQCVAWTLGTISYYALPTLGPGHRVPLRATPTCPNTGAIAADDLDHRGRGSTTSTTQRRRCSRSPASPACTSRSRC